MWALKGHQPEILTYGGRKRQHLIGAVEPLAGRVHIAFSEAMKAKQFEHFLEGLLTRYKGAGKILLILDNARAHLSKELEPFLKANEKKLELMFLPPYSPDMNPMEWFWKFLRKKVTHNTFFGTFKEFQRAMIKFIIKYKLPSQEIKTRCSFSKIFSSS
jgi:transposase